jgi:SAM-dependent methyltransferase
MRAAHSDVAEAADRRWFSMTDAYGEDLAYIHDAGFGHFATNAAPLLLEGLRRRGLDSGLVVDLGCGSGILAEAISTAGYEVLGIDISPAMVAMARDRVPNGRFRVGSLLAAELPPCVAVAAVGECFNYLFDSGNTGQGLVALFRRIYGALSRGGQFVFDVAGPGRVPVPRRTFTEGDGWAVLVTAEEDRGAAVLTRRITSFRRVGQLYRRDEGVHRLRLMGRAEVASELRGIGYRVRPLAGYGPLRFPPGHAGFLASKP